MSSADFDANYQPINAGYPGGAAGGVTVQTGDTLSSIAQTVWGDAALWYLIADANGVTNDTALVAGQRLIIPNKVTNFHNNSSTFRVYNPGEAIGDTLPTLPAQPAFPTPRGNQNNCGGFGAILLAAIAVAVTVVTSGAAAAASISAVSGTSVSLGAGITAAFGGTLGAAAGAAAGFSLTTAGMIGVGALGAVVGSVASQAFGVATGLQDKFSWKGVALAGLSGGVGGGLGSVIRGAGTVDGAARGLAGNAVTQGIGVATGLQGNFDWAGLAAAGIGALGRGVIGGGYPGAGADLVASAASRSLLTGSSFGDNLMSALPGVIGNTIGNLVAGRIAGTGNGTEASKPIRTAQNGAAPRMPGQADVRSDALTFEEEVVVYGQRLADQAAKAKHGLFDWFDGVFNTNLGGHNPHDRSKRSDPVIIFYQPSVRTGAGYDRMWQPLNGRSSYDAGRQFTNIVSDARNVSLGTTLWRLGEWSIYTVPDAAQRNANLFDPYRGMTPEGRAFVTQMDRLEGGTISGIALGVANGIGASPATQDLVYGLGSSADGLVMAYGGVRGAVIPGNNSQTSLSVEANLRLRYMPEWTAEQRAAADLKVGVLNFSDATVSQAVRGGTSARSMFVKENGSIAPSYDIDHLIDLQLGGSHTLRNFWPLDSSVNRSLGPQIQKQIEGLPPGTKINGVTIGN